MRRRQFLKSLFADVDEALANMERASAAQAQQGD
jgi:hypothetical protein